MNTSIQIDDVVLTTDMQRGTVTGFAPANAYPGAYWEDLHRVEFDEPERDEGWFTLDGLIRDPDAAAMADDDRLAA